MAKRRKTKQLNVQNLTQFFRIANIRRSPKTISQKNAFEQAVNDFANKNYLESFRNYLIYLQDKNTENVVFEVEDNCINFEIIQGSYVIVGIFDGLQISASSILYYVQQLNSDLIAELLRINYELYYCKMAYNNNQILLEAQIPAEMSHPSYINSTFEEMAINGDKYDDILLSKYNFLEKKQHSYIENFPADIETIIYKYLKQWTIKALEDINKYDVSRMAGTRTYILISTILKINLLLNPHGIVEEEIKKILQQFKTNDFNAMIFNVHATNLLKQLATLEQEKINENFYLTKYTFNPLEVATNLQVQDFIKTEINKVYTYEAMNSKQSTTKNYFDLLYIYDYIAAYIQTNWNIDEIWDELLWLYWEVRHSQLFADLGYQTLIFENNKFKIADLNIRIKNLNSIAKARFKEFNLNIKHLNTDTIHDFVKSFFQTLIILNFK